MYGAEREIELEVLCHDGLRRELAERDIVLASFKGMGRWG
jgi:hypothetical protein